MTDGLSREERTPCVCLFQSAHLGATGLTAHTPGWFLLSTLTLCDTTLCDRNTRRAEEIGPSSYAAKGNARVGPAIEHRCACLPIKDGELFSNTSQCVMWDKLPQQSEKSRESGWDIAFCLGLFFPPEYTFIFICRTRQGIWVQT